MMGLSGRKHEASGRTILTQAGEHAETRSGFVCFFAFGK